jgi:hypothetical protein
MTHCPRIEIKFIEPNHQRFKPECGDWFYDADEHKITVFVNRMADWRSELAVMLHEVFESVSCIASGIDQTDVDLFDKLFYRNHDHENDEAGDSKDAPYSSQHRGASFVEKEACSQLNLPWKKHEENCQ